MIMIKQLAPVKTKRIVDSSSDIFTKNNYYYESVAVL